MGELCGRCGTGKLCVSSSGEIYPCVFARFAPIGHVRKGMAEAFNAEELRDFRQRLTEANGPSNSGAHDVSGTSRAALLISACTPEKDPGPCTPEKDPGPCTPEKNPGPCTPENKPGPCLPEQDQGPCGPEEPSFSRGVAFNGLT